MPFTVTMPKLSPTMEEGTIAKWHKKEGDEVSPGDLLVEVATDKATLEYQALDPGFLRKILVEEGSMAKINQPIAVFSKTKEESIATYEPQWVGPPPEETKKGPEATSPKEPSTTKTPSFSMEQPHFAPAPPQEDISFPFATNAKGKRPVASPLAKKLAKEKNLDLSSVKGSGPRGRITSKDLALAQPGQSLSFGRERGPQVPSGTYRTVPLSPMRSVIAKRLQQAKTFIPHIYLRQEIDAAPLLAFREQLKKGNLKISVNDIILRASALALREHPSCNSGFDASTQSILLFETIDIAVAVSVEGGLITPIIRYADYKNLGEIATEVQALAEKARKGKLTLEEYQGGSFTVSNLGMYKISDFCAIINPPQAAILAVGGIEEKACVKNGEIVVGQRMQLVLSVDHRVLDGADAAQFLKKIQHYLENPALVSV